MSRLKDILLAEIASGGAMTLDAYMRRALTDPEHGYYMKRHPFGTPDADGGDFITAPEVSQMFGELLGAWVADLWTRMGAPAPFCLAELGAGRGTLMADMLRTASMVEGFTEAAQVHFVEISPSLREMQKQAVPTAFWHDDTTTLPPMPSLCLANEFFDALPIRQFKRVSDTWCEVVIRAQDNALIFDTSDAVEQPFSDAHLACLPDTIKEGSIVETCPDGEAVMAQLSAHISAHGGAALLIDYGHSEQAHGDSFQALHKHRFVDPLDAPGMADITAHVNFPLLARLAQQAGLHTTSIIEQGAFLDALGLSIRTQQLVEASPEHAAQIQSERHRLAAPQAMGSLFKVLGVAHKDTPPMAGF